MDCPRCGEPSLMGATHCVSCGGSLFGPAPGAQSTASAVATDGRTRSRALEVPRQAAREHESPPRSPAGGSSGGALCTICLGPCETVENAERICASCRDLSQWVEGDLGQSEVTFHPATASGRSLGDRMGSKELRPRPVSRRKRGVRRGPLVAVTGLVLGLATVSVVIVARPPDPHAALLAEVQPRAGKIVLAVPEKQPVRLRASYALRIRRAAARGGFSSSADDVFDLEQRSQQDSEVALVRVEGRASVVDVASECFLLAQDGRAAKGDPRELDAYPWVGRRSVVRLHLAAARAPTILGGGRPSVGPDVPPFLTVGMTGARAGEIEPGATWSGATELPLLADRRGALVPSPFDCEFEYVGRKIVSASPCHVIRVAGRPSRRLAGELSEFNRVAGSVRGVLFFDTRTGLLVKANLLCDCNVRAESGRLNDQVWVSGEVVISRL